VSIIKFLIFFSSIFAYDGSGWSAITSYITPTDLFMDDDGMVYASTSGGLFKFDTSNNKFTLIGLEHGLIYLDLSSISMDMAGRLWLGGSAPRGCLQVYDFENGLITFFEDDQVNSIGKIVMDDSVVLMVYEGIEVGDVGFLEFRFDENGFPEYKDYYNNFSNENISTIYDIDISVDSIYVTTDKGLFSGSKNDNLKFSSNWYYASGNFLDGISLKQFIIDESSYLFSNNSIYKFHNGIWEKHCGDYDGNIIKVLKKDNRIGVLTDEYFYEYINCEETILQIPFGSQVNSWSSIGIDFKTYFTSFLFNDEDVVFGIKDNGISFWNKVGNTHDHHVPNSPIKNEFNAISIAKTGALIATSHFGTIYNDKEKFINYVPNIYAKYYDSTPESYKLISLDYLPGDIEHVPISILEKTNGNLIFCNSGVKPNYDSGGAVIEINPLNNEFIKYGVSDGIIDGWAGIYAPDDNSHYMLINQIEEDAFGNVWIVNPFCESEGHILAIQSAIDDSWAHVMKPNDISYRPQTIAVQSIGDQQRIWIGFAHEVIDGPTVYSKGGLKMFNSSGIFSTDWDSSWFSISNPSLLPGNDRDASVWSIVFDQMGWLWVMNERAIRAYTLSTDYIQKSITLHPVAQYLDGSNIDYLSSIGFSKGNRIKVDGQNNKWIITHNGVWVIKESMLFWPSENGINVENSGLLSNKVYDIAFDDQRGLAMFATEKGISVFEIPFSKEPSVHEDIYITPNPFIIPDDQYVRIGNVYSGSKINIMTISGRIIKSFELDENESFLQWDGKGNDGRFVGSAVYLVASDHFSGNNKIGKLSIIRK